MFQNQKRAKAARAKAFAKQAEHSNRSGRHRTADYQLPKSVERPTGKVEGKGKWKRWTPDAVLRAAFSKENMSVRDVATGVDGASHKHASDCKLFVAELIMRAQRTGLAQFQEEAEREGPQGMKFALLNMIFDETELDLNLPGFGPGSWPVLACQVSFHAGGQTHDFDVIPQWPFPTSKRRLCGRPWHGLTWVVCRTSCLG